MSYIRKEKKKKIVKVHLYLQPAELAQICFLPEGERPALGNEVVEVVKTVNHLEFSAYFNINYKHYKLHI